MSSGDERRPLLAALARFLQDRRGATAVIFAIALPVLAGMGALAVNVGVWTVQKRQAQGAADAAAYSAAIAARSGGNTAQATIEARGIAANQGFVNGTGGVTVLVNNPPTSGSQSGVSGYWEVIIQQPQSLGLAGLFLATAPSATGRAVAGTSGTSGGCIIALSTSASNAVLFDNNAQLANPNCAIYSNSSASTAVQCNNNCVITASMYTVGSVGWGNAKPTGPINTGQAATADPYAGTTVTPPACGAYPAGTPVGAGSYTAGANGTRFCGGISIPNNSPSKTLNFGPGVYYIDNIFSLGNGVTINGTGGVTLIFRPSGTGAFTWSLGNNLVWNLTAPSTGPYQGIAMMQLTNTPASLIFPNNSVFNIQGALYFPTQAARFENNFNSAYCTQVVALTVYMSNNATMNASCPGSGIKGPGALTTALIE